MSCVSESFPIFMTTNTSLFYAGSGYLFHWDVTYVAVCDIMLSSLTWELENYLSLAISSQLPNLESNTRHCPLLNYDDDSSWKHESFESIPRQSLFLSNDGSSYFLTQHTTQHPLTGVPFRVHSTHNYTRYLHAIRVIWSHFSVCIGNYFYREFMAEPT